MTSFFNHTRIVGKICKNEISLKRILIDKYSHCIQLQTEDPSYKLHVGNQDSNDSMVE